MPKKKPTPKTARITNQKKPAPPRLLSREMTSEAENMVRNGLSEAIMGFTPQSMGVQLSQAETLFKNNRWYLISNMRQLLSQIYVEHGLIRTVVDVPVDDAFRHGYRIKTKQLSPEELEKLEAEIDREGDVHVGSQAQKWNRLYGGAGIIILTDQDPETPFDISSIREGDALEYRAVDMWELYWDKQNTEGYDVTLQEQEYEFYSYYGLKLHKSRVLKMKGLTAPSFIRPRLRGWGFSIIESVVRSINQFLKETDLTFEVLDEFKLDIYKLDGLATTLMSDEGTAQVRKRVQMTNQQKNFQNAITLDSKDDYVQKQLTFAGLAEIMKEIRMQIACDLRMPLTKIFGISAAGFNSGEDDIENYNSMVESEVRAKTKYEFIKMLEIRCQRMFGMVPSDLSISYEPLRVLSSEQEENVKNAKFARLMQAKQANEITSLEFRDACNKEELLPIQLETDDQTLQDLEDTAALGAGDGEANRTDSQKAVAPPAAPASSTAAKEAPEVKNSYSATYKGKKIVIEKIAGSLRSFCYYIDGVKGSEEFNSEMEAFHAAKKKVG